MDFNANSDMLKAKLGEEDSKQPVFTEEDREKIRQTLTHFSNRQTKKIIEVKKTVNPIPHINNQKYHVSFSWKDWPKELDEVPHLFLFRLHIWPLLLYKNTISLEELQSLCVLSGISGIAMDNKASGYYMAGIFENGGTIDKVFFTLSPTTNKEVVVIDNCTFKTLIE